MLDLTNLRKGTSLDQEWYAAYKILYRVRLVDILTTKDYQDWLYNIGAGSRRLTRYEKYKARMVQCISQT